MDKPAVGTTAANRSQRAHRGCERADPLAAHELTNAQLAELLAQHGEKARPPLTRAFRRASRRAFLWPEEAYSLQKLGRSLTELKSIGPYLEKLIQTWFNDASSPPLPPAIRAGFLTFTQAQELLASHWPRVFALAAEPDKAVEIDAYPDRQDLSPDLLGVARDAGCRISFGTMPMGRASCGLWRTPPPPHCGRASTANAS